MKAQGAKPVIHALFIRWISARYPADEYIRIKFYPYPAEFPLVSGEHPADNHRMDIVFYLQFACIQRLFCLLAFREREIYKG